MARPFPAGEALPPIIPVVLAQNANTWNLSPQFASLFDLPKPHNDHLRPYIPDFTFHLLQLASMPFDSIRGTPAGIMIMRTMKAERIASLLAAPVWDEALLIQVPQSILELLFRYMLGSD